MQTSVNAPLPKMRGQEGRGCPKATDLHGRNTGSTDHPVGVREPKRSLMAGCWYDVWIGISICRTFFFSPINIWQSFASPGLMHRPRTIDMNRGPLKRPTSANLQPQAKRFRRYSLAEPATPRRRAMATHAHQAVRLASIQRSSMVVAGLVDPHPPYSSISGISGRLSSGVALVRLEMLHFWCSRHILWNAVSPLHQACQCTPSDAHVMRVSAWKLQIELGQMPEPMEMRARFQPILSRQRSTCSGTRPL